MKRYGLHEFHSIMHKRTSRALSEYLLVKFNSVVTGGYVPHIPQTSDPDAALY